jgi:hypothetical protein
MRLGAVLARKQKNEAVTVSFHYLVRQTHGPDGNPQVRPFSPAEFGSLCDRLAKLPPMDLSSDKVRDSLKFRNTALIEHVEQIDDRTMFGVYHAGYWGHAYNNSDKGKIPAESVSLRPFHFLIYLGESGRIYLASQYIGNFGGYGAIEKTVRSFLPDDNGVTAYTFRLESASYKGLTATEVRVQVSAQPESVASQNQFGSRAAITFKKDRKDDLFSVTVSERLLPFLGGEEAVIKHAVAELLNDNELLDIADANIEDCTIVGYVGRKRKTVRMIESGSFATRFEINVPINDDGHPEYEPTRSEMLKVLRNQIIARKENV